VRKWNDWLILGDIVISVDTAKRQAQELGHSLEEELKRLLVHGLVHLLGYDHELGGEEEKKFFELEEFVLKEFKSPYNLIYARLLQKTQVREIGF
jgi:probable rRNA maturation factor